MKQLTQTEYMEKLKEEYRYVSSKEFESHSLYYDIIDNCLYLDYVGDEDNIRFQVPLLTIK